jgi:hypothetical protein
MWSKEKQNLLRTRSRGLRLAENKAEQLTEENKALYAENKDLRFEKEETNDLLREILKITIVHPNEKIALSKIKELVRDYQSQN